MSLGKLFLARFRNLTTDSVPQPARPTVNIEEVPTEQLNDNTETENDEAGKPQSPKKEKKNFFWKRNSTDKKSKPEDHVYHREVSSEPMVQTQATGDVLNIIQSTGVHVGTTNNISIGPKDKKDADSDSEELSIEKTPAINQLLVSDNEITHDYLDYTSKNIGSGWKKIMRQMGITDGRIQIVTENYLHCGLDEVIYQLLLEWKRSKAATLSDMAILLWCNNKRVVVQKLAEIHQNKADQA